MNIKTISWKFIACLLAYTSSVTAEQDNFEYIQKEPATSQNLESTSCVQKGVQNNHCFSPPACCPPTCQFFVRGDVLYWAPRLTGLELDFGTASITESFDNSTQILSTTETDIDPHFRWNAGYRLGVGFETDHWTTEALWTHFSGEGKRSGDSDENLTNRGKVKIKFDQIDLAFTYNCNPLCCLSLNPFIGARGARIREHLDVLTTTQITTLPDTIAYETRALDDKQKYWGVGPLVGVQGICDLGCGFGIYGTVAGSVLYGEYTVKFDDSDIFSTPISKQISSVNKRHVHAFDYNIDFALGLCWNTCICNNWEISMKLGYEQHQYFNQNRLCADRGDLSFSGGVFSLALGF